MKFGSSRDLMFDEALDEIRLQIRDGNELIACRVSREALEALVSREQTSPGELLRIAHYYFEFLTEKWEYRVQLGVCEPDGSILLRRSDVMSAIPSGAGRPPAVRYAY